MTLDPARVCVTYSERISGDRLRRGLKSRIETSIGNESGKRWVIAPTERGSAYSRGKLYVYLARIVHPRRCKVIFDGRLQKVNRFPLDETAGERNRSTYHPLSVFARVYPIGSLFQTQTLFPIPIAFCFLICFSLSLSLTYSLSDTLPSTSPQWMSRHYESLSKNVVRTTRDPVLKTYQGCIPGVLRLRLRTGILRGSQITGNLRFHGE